MLVPGIPSGRDVYHITYPDWRTLFVSCVRMPIRVLSEGASCPWAISIIPILNMEAYNMMEKKRAEKRM